MLWQLVVTITVTRRVRSSKWCLSAQLIVVVRDHDGCKAVAVLNSWCLSLIIFKNHSKDWDKYFKQWSLHVYDQLIVSVCVALTIVKLYRGRTADI